MEVFGILFFKSEWINLIHYIKMKHLLAIIFFLSLFFYSCITIKPNDFTYLYNGQESGIETLIDINGYYITQRECDSTFFSVFMFYPDGLFTIATGSDLSEVIRCFNSQTNNKNICKYPSWGTYKIAGDTIKTQTIRNEGIAMSTIFRDYLILPDKDIVNISDYVNPLNTKIGYMKNYPSFKENYCTKTAIFYPLENKKDSSDCPFLKKKWFVQ